MDYVFITLFEELLIKFLRTKTGLKQKTRIRKLEERKHDKKKEEKKKDERKKIGHTTKDGNRCEAGRGLFFERSKKSRRSDKKH
jgi:hypothetical protein